MTDDEANEWYAQFLRELPHWERLKKEHKRGSSGTCTCPRCGEECVWSIASVNGHLWAKCRTDGCVSFME